ncbi:HdeD family acid-resistance protein [Roseovarius sp. Pro17]|uniref:HdeD family acid-resistance protein n=1 Tax=Roseovarius sp. Pro17 TaxID=3108175 RepID=UPI002D790936|nr:HdeD family acid-resistance protein [Roseovarius sp. Pro17]
MTDQYTPHDPAMPDTPASEAAYAAGQEAAHNKWLLLIIGIVTLIGGLLAIAMPLIASFTAALVMAWVLIASGIVGIIAAFRRRHGWHMLAAFLSAALSVVIGLLILAQPMIGLITITALIIVFFATSGALRIYYGARLIKTGAGGGWMIAGGALSLLLAVMLISGLPFSAAWVPGVLLGIDLTIWGAILIAIGTRAAQLSAARDISVTAS